VAVIVAARRHAGLAGKTLQLTGVPPAVGSFAKLYGVESYVTG
jgi:ABC-type transporter Mla MlaB component